MDWTVASDVARLTGNDEARAENGYRSRVTM